MADSPARPLARSGVGLHRLEFLDEGGGLVLGDLVETDVSDTGADELLELRRVHEVSDGERQHQDGGGEDHRHHADSVAPRGDEEAVEPLEEPVAV